MKNIKTSYILIGVAILFVGGIASTKLLQSSDPNVLSKSGIHWHPTLTIYAKGEKQSLPANLGVRGSSMASLHTHKPDGEVHLEFGGAVRKENIMLGQFFKSWGKEFNSFGSNVTMTVNGKENTELENYQMKDGDKIELRYE